MANGPEDRIAKLQRLFGAKDEALIQAYAGIQSRETYIDTQTLAVALYERGEGRIQRTGLWRAFNLLPDYPLKSTRVRFKNVAPGYIDWSCHAATDANNPLSLTNHLDLIRTPEQTGTGIPRDDLTPTRLRSAIQYQDRAPLRLDTIFTSDADVASISLIWPSADPGTIYYLTQEIAQLAALGKFVNDSYVLKDARLRLMKAVPDKKSGSSQLIIDFTRPTITHSQQVRVDALTPAILDTTGGYDGQQHTTSLYLKNNTNKTYSLSSEYFYNPRTQTFVRFNPHRPVDLITVTFLRPELREIDNYYHIPKDRPTFALDEFRDLANAALALTSLISPEIKPKFDK